jgi:hypothetical protein
MEQHSAGGHSAGGHQLEHLWPEGVSNVNRQVLKKWIGNNYLDHYWQKGPKGITIA